MTQQPPTQNDQEHVFSWLNLLAPTLTTPSRHLNLKTNPPKPSPTSHYLPTPTQPLLGIKPLEPTCTVIQLRIQIRQTFEASCRPGTGFPRFLHPSAEPQKKRVRRCVGLAPLRVVFLVSWLAAFLGGNEDEKGFRRSCFVVFFFRLGCLLGRWRSGLGSLGVNFQRIQMGERDVCCDC